jgi:hypothetical protein
MRKNEELKIEFLDVDPQQSPEHRAPELHLPSDEEIRDEMRREGEQNVVNDNVIRVRHEHSRRPGKIKTALYAGGAALALYGAYNVYQGLTSGGGSHMQAEAQVEETRVTVYENTPLQLAGIDSDLNLQMTAGYDRTGPIPGLDINPINNMYTFDQEDLTTHTEATVTVETMTVEESETEISVTLQGDIELSNASIDWSEEEFAGADISGTSVSIGNDLKDRIDNDALEIFQDSAGVAASCALLDEKIQPVITDGVSTFLKIVKPELNDSTKPLRVRVQNLRSRAQTLYIEAKDRLQDTLREIESSYSGKDDTFEADVSQILDCNAQNIRLVRHNTSEN